MASSNETFILVGKNETPKLLELIFELSTYEKTTPYFKATVEGLQKSILDEKVITAYLIQFEKQIVGYMIYFFTYSAIAGKKLIYLEDLYVKEEFRKNNLGTKAFYKLAEECLLNDCERLEWLCYDWNLLGKNFYEKKLKAKQRLRLDPYFLEKSDFEKMVICKKPKL